MSIARVPCEQTVDNYLSAEASALRRVRVSSDTLLCVLDADDDVIVALKALLLERRLQILSFSHRSLSFL